MFWICFTFEMSVDLVRVHFILSRASRKDFVYVVGSRCNIGRSSIVVDLDLCVLYLYHQLVKKLVDM